MGREEEDFSHYFLLPFYLWYLKYIYTLQLGLPQWLSGKVSACNSGDPGSIPGSRRSLGGGDGNPLQYSCLENSMERGVWQVTVHRVIKSQTWLSNWKRTHTTNVQRSLLRVSQTSGLLCNQITVQPGQDSNKISLESYQITGKCFEKTNKPSEESEQGANLTQKNSRRKALSSNSTLGVWWDAMKFRASIRTCSQGVLIRGYFVSIL